MRKMTFPLYSGKIVNDYYERIIGACYLKENNLNICSKNKLFWNIILTNKVT